MKDGRAVECRRYRRLGICRLALLAGLWSLASLVLAPLAANATTQPGVTVAPAVATSGSFSLALDAAGQVYAWGSDAYGQLGQGRPIVQASPVRVTGIPAMKHVSLFDQVLAVDLAGQVWAWGDDLCPHLGPRENPNSSKPSRLIGATGMAQVAAGHCQSYALKTDGTVWQLRLGGPVLLPFPSSIVEISAGGRHLLALRNDGTVWAYGLNDAGQLGIGNTEATTEVVQVTGLTGVTSVSAGWRMSVALLANGDIRAWGRYSATLGPLTLPTPVSGLGGAAIAVRAVNNGLAAARQDGTVWVWNSSLTSAVQAPGMTGAARIEYDANSGRELFAISATGALTAQGSNNNGQLGQGTTDTISGTVPVPGFSADTAIVRVGFFSPSVAALKNDGSIWFWGANPSGQRGDAVPIGSALPLRVAIAATVKAVAASDRFALALDTTGRVWGWGDNAQGPIGANRVSASSPLIVPDIDNVAAIAAGGSSIGAFVKADGTAWVSGTAVIAGISPRQVQSLSNITGVSAGINGAFFLRNDGVVFAIGGNAYGELGDGTTTARTSPVPVQGIPSAVKKIVSAEFRSCALTEDGRVFTWGSSGAGEDLTGGTYVAVPIPGVSTAVDIAVSRDGVLIRLADGTVLGVASTLHADGNGRGATQPYPIAIPEPVQAFALGQLSAVLVGSKGLVWGWGANRLGTGQGTVGDGTFVPRNRAVVLLAPNGNGSIDGNNWYLDLQPVTPESIPPALTPMALATAQLFGGAESLAFDGTVRYRSGDLGRRVNNYVMGLVPPIFLSLVRAAPGTSGPAALSAKAAKSGGFVLVQLTPQGWTDVNGQLVAYSSGTAAAQGGATNILNGINTSSLAGSRFCVGYGETAGSMLSSQSLREVLAIEGSQASDSGIPCVLSGVYVSGPPSSVEGSAVAFTASVVGIAPTGSVQFKDGTAPLGAPLPLAEANPAMGTASLTTSTLAVGVHSIGASYPGGGLNAASSTEVPLLHVVGAAQASTRVEVQGPASSALGSEVAFTATVTGNNPVGTVQFLEGGSALGAALPVVNGQATLRTTALALGLRTLTASYSGDERNSQGVSSPLAHTVANVIATRVEVSSSANPAPEGTVPSLTVTVRGTGTPTGNVTLRNGASAVETKALAAGTTSFSLAALAPGVHAVRVDYLGDEVNVAASSEVLFQEVALSSGGEPPAAITRLTNISTRGLVQTGADVMIGGFVIGGSSAKKVLITARGPSLGSFGIPNPLANPKIELFSGQNKLMENDNWQAQSDVAGGSASVGAIQALGIFPNGLAPSNANEAALMVTLAPGAYTAVVSGADGGTGVGIVEVFEQDGPAIPLVNISTRGKVLTGTDVMIGGFVVTGSTPQTVLITARGPSLVDFGIAAPLANPKLEIFSGQTKIYENDNWQAQAAIAGGQAPSPSASISALGTFPNGLAPSNANEAALLVTLPPGAYTAVVSGVNNGTGVAIVEVFAR